MYDHSCKRIYVSLHGVHKNCRLIVTKCLLFGISNNNYKYHLLGEPSVVSLETQADREQGEKEPGKTGGGHDQH